MRYRPLLGQPVARQPPQQVALDLAGIGSNRPSTNCKKAGICSHSITVIYIQRRAGEQSEGGGKGFHCLSAPLSVCCLPATSHSLFSGDGLLSVCLPAAGFSSLADLVAAELFQSAKNIVLTRRLVALDSQQRSDNRRAKVRNK